VPPRAPSQVTQSPHHAGGVNSDPPPPRRSPSAVGGAGSSQRVSPAPPPPTRSDGSLRTPGGGPFARPPPLWPAPSPSPSASDDSDSNSDSDDAMRPPGVPPWPPMLCEGGGAGVGGRVVFLAPGLPPWRVFVDQLLPRGLEARRELGDAVLALRTALLRGAGSNAPLTPRRGWAPAWEPVKVQPPPLVLPPPKEWQRVAGRGGEGTHVVRSWGAVSSWRVGTCEAGRGGSRGTTAREIMVALLSFYHWYVVCQCFDFVFYQSICDHDKGKAVSVKTGVCETGVAP
jgi:hypothetical protein